MGSEKIQTAIRAMHPAGHSAPGYAWPRLLMMLALFVSVPGLALALSGARDSLAITGGWGLFLVLAGLLLAGLVVQSRREQR